MFTIWEVLAIVALTGIMVSANGFLVGWLVYRSKREQFEYLSPPARAKEPQGAVNVDDLARQEMPDSGLPDTLKHTSSVCDGLLQAAEAAERVRKTEEKEKSDG